MRFASQAILTYIYIYIYIHIYTHKKMIRSITYLKSATAADALCQSSWAVSTCFCNLTMCIAMSSSFARLSSSKVTCINVCICMYMCIAVPSSFARLSSSKVTCRNACICMYVRAQQCPRPWQGYLEQSDLYKCMHACICMCVHSNVLLQQ
jgi:hypothetical protein